MIYYHRLNDGDLPSFYCDDAREFIYYEDGAYKSPVKPSKIIHVPLREFFSVVDWEEVISEIERIILPDYHVGIVTRHPCYCSGGKEICRIVDVGFMFHKELVFDDMEEDKWEEPGLTNVGWKKLSSISELDNLLRHSNEKELLNWFSAKKF